MSKVLEFIYTLFQKVSDFVSQIWDFFAGIPEFVKRFFVWLFDALSNVFPWLVKTVGSAVGTWINGLIASDSSGFLAAFLSGGGAISSGVAYFLGPFNIGLGLKFILAAYLIRFLIRRIPIVG